MTEWAYMINRGYNMDSFIPWVGGKKQLRKEIVKRFPQNIDRYVEVFGGAAWVLFYAEKHANEEIYNDINGELVNLFRMVKYHPNAVAEELKFTLNARETFEQYKINKGMTEIQRAAMFYYLIRTSYGANTQQYGKSSRNAYSFINDIEGIQKRLLKVIIENKNFSELIEQYDKETTLFYCDPPYYKSEKRYIKDIVFGKQEHILLYETLCNIKGKFVLSYNDDDFIKELYKEFDIQEVERKSNLSNCNGKTQVYKELIITNF